MKDNDVEVYRTGRRNMEAFLRKGFLKPDTEERFYVHETDFLGFRSLGVFLLCDIKDYESGRIKRHELTLKAKE
jgi:uncharacterized protein (DUF1015 family)